MCSAFKPTKEFRMRVRVERGAKQGRQAPDFAGILVVDQGRVLE